MMLYKCRTHKHLESGFKIDYWCKTLLLEKLMIALWVNVHVVLKTALDAVSLVVWTGSSESAEQGLVGDEAKRS